MVVPEIQHVHPAQVISWTDGDTVHLKVWLDYNIYGIFIHRLCWINAPEKRFKAGKIAWAYVQEKCPVGTMVVVRSYEIEGDEDNFGRWLAEIYHNGESFNQRLLMDGQAVPYDPTK